jgi:hypothetical protein
MAVSARSDTEEAVKGGRKMRLAGETAGCGDLHQAASVAIEHLLRSPNAP